MSKKNIIILVIIVVVLVVGFFLWKGGFISKNLKDAEINQESGVMGEIGEIGDKITGGVMGVKMTDDLYIEMMIELLKIQAEKNPVTYASEVENLYKKYGVTEGSLEAYAEELENNPQRAMELAQKYTQRLSEFQKLSQ